MGAPVVTFGKQTPAAGAILTSNAANFTWTSAPGVSFYETCLDEEAVNDGICDSGWLTAAQATSRLLTGLTDGTPSERQRARANGAGPWGPRE